MYFVPRVTFIILLILYLFIRSDSSNIENNNVNNAVINANSKIYSEVEVDCFGLGSTFANILLWFFKQQEKNIIPWFTTFYLRSRTKSHRDKVLIGDQFGLQWTDFDIRRKTIVIVHGFLSNGNEDWIRDMEDAFLLWVS